MRTEMLTWLNLTALAEQFAPGQDINIGFGD